MDSKIKTIPNNIEAEISILGGILLNPDSISRILDIVKIDDFYKNSHKVIYEIMLDLYNKGHVIDTVLLINELNKKGKMDEVGGEEEIFNFFNIVPTSANIVNYATIVKDKAMLRRLINVGTEIVEMAYEGYDEVDIMLDKVEHKIFKISQTKEKKEITSMKNLVDIEFDRLEKAYANKGEVIGISSGYKDFDQMTSGFHSSDLVIIAARPSMGKTSFALNIAATAALKQQKSVLIFSLEMSDTQIFQRFISIEASIPLQKIRTGFLNPDEWEKIGRATSVLAEAPIFIADMPNVSILEIRAIARRLKAENKLDMILIDYLQLIQGSNSGESRNQQISDISRSLKGLARELNVPVIALSQLSRGPEQRADRRPMLSDLRDSGAIEQDADVVLFLYRDDYYNEDSEQKDISELIIGKQRNGPVGTVYLRFFKEQTKFADLTTRVE